MKHQKWLRLISLLVVVSMLLAACGGDDDDDETPEAAATATTASTGAGDPTATTGAAAGGTTPEASAEATAGGDELGLKLVECECQRLGHEPTAEFAELVGNRRHLRPQSRVTDGCAPAVTRSCTAFCGSPPVTRLSPTSTASAPSAA